MSKFDAEDYMKKIYMPYLTADIKDGITLEQFKDIVRKEKLDEIPNGDGYGGYRHIELYPSRFDGLAWHVVIIMENGRYCLTSTGERGSRGYSYYFEDENIAFAHFVAFLRSLKN